ncbi:MAG: hypothetical protein DLM62_09410 [Pseudonocardiales bacterium]|nr:MAG: hypothetical protein DLM62_09410 [Pseudonocardiales bacterium]
MRWSRLPWTAPLFLLAVLALSAIPPFGLFRSEFLIVAGGLRSAHFAPAAAMVALVTPGVPRALDGNYPDAVPASIAAGQPRSRNRAAGRAERLDGGAHGRRGDSAARVGSAPAGRAHRADRPGAAELGGAL